MRLLRAPRGGKEGEGRGRAWRRGERKAKAHEERRRYSRWGTETEKKNEAVEAY